MVDCGLSDQLDSKKDKLVVWHIKCLFYFECWSLTFVDDQSTSIAEWFSMDSLYTIKYVSPHNSWDMTTTYYIIFLIVNFSAAHALRHFNFLVGQNHNPFWDIDNLLRMLLESTTVPINQHEIFQCVLSSLTRFLRNFLKSHSSHNYSKLNTLNSEVL